MKGKKYSGINMEKTGNWLRCICKHKGFTVKNLCDSLGLGSPQSIYGWFCGRTLPSLDNFYVLSQILGVQLDELIVNYDEEIPIGFSRKIGPQNSRLMLYYIRFTF